MTAAPLQSWSLRAVAMATVFGFGIAALEIAIPYHRYARILRWLCLSLVSYLIVLLIVNVAVSPDAQEGIDAFLNKRHPEFRERP